MVFEQDSIFGRSSKKCSSKLILGENHISNVYIFWGKGLFNAVNLTYQYKLFSSCCFFPRFDVILLPTLWTLRSAPLGSATSIQSSTLLCLTSHPFNPAINIHLLSHSSLLASPLHGLWFTSSSLCDKVINLLRFKQFTASCNSINSHFRQNN